MLAPMKRFLSPLAFGLVLLAATSCSSSYRESESSVAAAGSTATGSAAAGAPAEDVTSGAGGDAQASGDAMATLGAGGAGDSVRTGPPEPRFYPVIAYVVRHAEAAQDGTPDPPLTDAGRARAAELRDRLRSEGITALFSSPYRRTRDTAAPLAEALELPVRPYDPRDSQALARTLYLEHRGGKVLIVGHSNTVPLIVEALGGMRPPDLAHSEHDAMFIVEAHGLKVPAKVRRLRYGAPGDTTTAP